MSNDLLNALASAPANNGASAARARAGASVTPAARAANDSAQSADELNNRFLKLLVAQMKNQDPLNPTDNSKVTSQIAQINQVSGINQVSDQLKTINGQIDTSQQIQASGLIGRDVLVPGDSVRVGDSGSATAFGIDLPKDAAQVKLTISDAAGTVVHKSSYDNQPAGVQSFSWDGMTAGGDAAGPGRYRINVQAQDSQGEPVQAQPLAMGYVDGVVSGQSGAQLDLGPNGLASLDDVYQIVGE